MKLLFRKEMVKHMYRVIVADDESIERMVVEKSIRKYFDGQLEVILAVNGREAVELYQETKCHIVILDIEMPGIDGLKAAEMIRQMDKECSIIFLTAFDEFSYAKKAITVKALDYLLKPVVNDELVAVLEEAIRLVQEKEIRSSVSGCEDTIVVDEIDSLKDAHEERQRSIGNATMSENFRMNAIVENIRVYVEKHYMEDIALQDVATAMNYSDAYFCKLFKQCFEKNFVSYLTGYRVKKAKEMLRDIRINVKDVSAKVGYRDSNYFAKVFKRVVGITPSEYRIQVLQNDKGARRIDE